MPSLDDWRMGQNAERRLYGVKTSSPPDIPGPICWLRISENYSCTLVIGIGEEGVKIGNEIYPWRSLEKWEHSTDRQTWQPCRTTLP